MELADGGVWFTAARKSTSSPADHPSVLKACFARATTRQLKTSPTVDNMSAGRAPAQPAGLQLAPIGGGLEEVEAVSSIVKRFKAAAMSYGALAGPETIAIA